MTAPAVTAALHSITNGVIIGILRIGEVLAAGALLYWFRIFERLMGTSKFLGFAFVTALVASTIQLGLLVSFPGMQRIAPGPYPLLYALFVQYYGALQPWFHHSHAPTPPSPLTFTLLAACSAKIPKSVQSHFRLAGVDVTDKTVTYLVGLQLAFNGGMESVVAAVSGILCGVLYASDVLRLSSFRFPKKLRDAFEVTAPCCLDAVRCRLADSLRARPSMRVLLFHFHQ